MPSPAPSPTSATMIGRTLLAAAWLAGAGAAQAETSPYYLGVSQTFSYNSNVFRQIKERAEASWWSTTSLVGGFDQLYGRQRFYANGNVAANVYGQLSELDNTSYGVTAGWDWATIERLSGTVYANFNQNLANYGGFYQSLGRVKNTQNSTLAYATVRYGLLSLWEAFGRVDYSSVHYSARQYDRYELDQSSVTAGLRKQISGQLTLGGGLAYTSGDYFSIDQQFSRYDVFFTGNWQATGQSVVSGRLGYSWWNYTGVDPVDQSGATGWLAWDYTPTGKLSFKTLLSYDSQANSALTPVGGDVAGGVGTTKWLTAGLQLSATYAYSAKTSFNASLQYYSQNRDFALNPGGGASLIDVNARNHITNLALGATWTPTRNWQVQCNATLNDRNQRGSEPITLTPYTAWGGSCAAQFVLQ